MARISKSNIYAIQWLNSQNLNDQEIAHELGLTEKQVSNTLKKVSQTPSEPETQATTMSRSRQLMINQTAGKKTNSVAIMTKEASMVNDSMKDKMHNTTKPNTDHYIFRPNN